MDLYTVYTIKHAKVLTVSDFGDFCITAFANILIKAISK